MKWHEEPLFKSIIFCILYCVVYKVGGIDIVIIGGISQILGGLKL